MVMKKESSNIKNIFSNLTKEKNDRATEEIKDKKFRVRKISEKELLGLASLFDLDNEKSNKR